MASTRETLDKFIELMHDIAENEFKDNDRTMIYSGKEYSKTDFKNMERAVKQVQKTYQIGVNKSVKYLKKNAEYNKTLRMISYYKNKNIKTIKDFEKLESLQKELDRITKERDELKLEETKSEVLARQIERDKRKFMESPRGIEDEYE